MSHWYCHNDIVTLDFVTGMVTGMVIALSIGVVTVILWDWYCHTGIVTLILLHWYCIKDWCCTTDIVGPDCRRTSPAGSSYQQLTWNTLLSAESTHCTMHNTLANTKKTLLRQRSPQNSYQQLTRDALPPAECTHCTMHKALANKKNSPLLSQKSQYWAQVLAAIRLSARLTHPRAVQSFLYQGTNQAKPPIEPPIGIDLEQPPAKPWQIPNTIAG